MRFEWDEAKNRSNRAKHRLSFETAQRVFLDPLHRSVPSNVVDGEQRWETIGIVDGVVVIVVLHTYSEVGGEETIRIISARRATRHERREYEC
ncbi:MAG: BrnT family toxin [Hyphomicrobium aestuarii]|nr:BrnT family toxin [Hyphomicrobium aestuarii]